MLTRRPAGWKTSLMVNLSYASCATGPAPVHWGAACGSVPKAEHAVSQQKCTILGLHCVWWWWWHHQHQSSEDEEMLGEFQSGCKSVGAERCAGASLSHPCVWGDGRVCPSSSSWGALGIPGGLRMSAASGSQCRSVLSQRNCSQGMEAFAFIRGGRVCPPSLPQAAFCSGQGPRLCGSFLFE